jgi:Beta-lactamase enzyme family
VRQLGYARVVIVAALPPRPPALIRPGGIVRAERYAAHRRGTVAFAVLGGDGAVHGLRVSERFPSASVVKAMLLVARLRELGSQPLTASDRATLRPMIERSDNEAAERIHAVVGNRRLYVLARTAGMRRFAMTPFLFDTQITAADQARFFERIDRLVPPRHRAYARRLLSGIIAPQRWGIAPVARVRHLKIFFKGGWRTGIVHQIALLVRGRRRVALAVLTSGESMGYGEATLSGIARRLLR